jgi:plastocyanin
MKQNILAICMLTALLLPGCGGGASAERATATGQGMHSGGGHSQSSPVVEGAPVIGVTASSFSFDPTGITIRANQDVTVALTATDTVHDLTIDSVGFHVAAQPGEPGRSGLKIAKPGTYTAYCSVPGHRAAGMEMKIVAQ